MSVQVKIHDVEEARKQAGPGRLPVLRYTDGTKYLLLPNGPRRRVDGLPSDVSGKKARRLRIKNRRFLKEREEAMLKWDAEHPEAKKAAPTSGDVKIEEGGGT